MAIKSISEKPVPQKIEIDLTGPDGNAFVLMGKARNLAKQLSYTQEQIDEIISEMKSSNYEYLLEVFDSNFGEYVTLYR